MDNFSATSSPIGQKLEIYTELFVIGGLFAMTPGRTSDVLNRTNTEFITLHDASITPIGQPPSPKAIESPVLVRRSLMNFLTELPSGKPVHPAVRGASGILAGREAYVQKNTFACYAFTGPFAIYGRCYLHQGTSLENLLQGVDSFFPITRASVHVLNRPDITWQRDLIIVNKTLLTAMYLLP